MKLGHRRSSEMTSPTPQSQSPQTMLIYNQTIPIRMDAKSPCHRKTVPPSVYVTLRNHVLVRSTCQGTRDSNPMCHQPNPEAVCSTQFQNIIPMPLNISPQTSLAYKQVILFMIEDWRQSHRKTDSSSCACETTESSHFMKILPTDLQRAISMSHHPRPLTRTLMTG